MYIVFIYALFIDTIPGKVIRRHNKRSTSPSKATSIRCMTSQLHIVIHTKYNSFQSVFMYFSLFYSVFVYLSVRILLKSSGVGSQLILGVAAKDEWPFKAPGICIENTFLLRDRSKRTETTWELNWLLYVLFSCVEESSLNSNKVGP